ncbi:uncharacterized protein LOC125955283 [Anopheles darlingi]|uniref:uncharacterized protein LOC125955283 n=1 Tax=Anopheles darlingi TaxID=43151 RepID=UPI0021002381|nr:uncharacterized protein LOC125955283 [Anopheles darlingi]
MVFIRKAIIAKRFQQAKRMRQAKRPKQAKRNGKNYIDSLPEELLCMVFDRLNLKNVKAASLTCHKWNDIIFFSGYANRFIFKINMHVSIPDSIGYHLHSMHRKQKLLELEELRKTHAEQTIRAITQSPRSYRSVKCETNETMCPHNPSLLAAIHQKFGNCLNTLELSFDGATMTNMFPWIVETIPLMPQLGTLKLEDHDRRTRLQDTLPTLRSQTLKHLVMRTNFKFGIDVPQLQSFDGLLPVLDRSIDSRQPLVITSLKHLTIREERYDIGSKTTVTRGPSIIRLLPSIESMVWEDDILDDEIFLAICEACTMLTDLKFTCSVWLSKIGIFSNLLKLTNLRKFSIESLCTDDESPLHLDFSSLTKLEKLAIVESGVDSLILPKSVKSLQLVVDKENKQRMRKTIINCSKQLIELGLVFVDWYNSEQKIPIETLRILPQLTNLETLEFTCGFFTKSTFLCLKSPMDRLRTLKLERDCVDTRRFLGLKEKFPNLKKVVMQTDNPRLVQTSTNPELYSAPATNINARSQSDFSDSDIDSFNSDLESDSFNSDSESETSFDTDGGTFSDSEEELYY